MEDLKLYGALAKVSEYPDRNSSVINSSTQYFDRTNDICGTDFITTE